MAAQHRRSSHSNNNSSHSHNNHNKNMSAFDSLRDTSTTSGGGGGGEGSIRMAQLMDESDHKRCSVGNQHALLAESLDRLRSLTQDLKEDDWKYNLPTSNSSNGPSGPE
eukprot:scaffold16939_cov51-Attheya_sp.AAC.2